MRDLIVAGGGPVGLATALHAARAGLDVVVREPRAGTVDKACGEGLMPHAVAELDALGVPLDGYPITGIRYLDRRHHADATFRLGHGRGVRRTALHAALVATVQAAGIDTEQRAVRSVEHRGDHVLVDGTPARYLIAADGLHSPVRAMCGLDLPATRHRRFGLRCHFEIEPWTSMVEVHWAGTSEAYVTPVGPQLVGVAILSGRSRSFTDLLAEHPQLSDRLASTASSRVLGAGPMRQRARRRVAGRVLLVGDAAGYIDALTGEGIALGFAQARAAIAAIRNENPQQYETAWRRLGLRHSLLTHALLASSRVPQIRRYIVPAAARLPRVFGAAVDQLARPA